MTDEVRTTFHRELDALRMELVELAARAGELVARATEALLDGDATATALLAADDELAEAQSQRIEQRCFRLLALQNPVAADLRTLAAGMRINSELLRAAELATSIARRAEQLAGVELPPRLRGLIAAMSEHAVWMLRIATDAFVERDAPLGAALDDIDNHLDDLQRSFMAAMFEAHDQHALGLAHSVQLALVARFFERIGDHAVNIGERVVFMASGSAPQHPGAERILQRTR